MTSVNKSVACAAITLCSFFGGFGVHPARAACSASLPMTYNGTYVDAFDVSTGIYLVFWGYQTYGDPQAFHDAAEFVFNVASTNRSFGIASTKFFGFASQYTGTDWGSGLNSQQILPTQFSYAIDDEGGLPAPNPITGQITLTDADVSNEADFIRNNFGATSDDIIVVMTPPNAPPPQSGACGKHFVTSNSTIAAWVTYPTFGCASFGGQESAILHEVSEAITDPAWNRGTNWEGWDQGFGAACECADICTGLSFSIQTQQASQTTSIIQTQPEFSNEALFAGQGVVPPGGNGCIYGRSRNAWIAGLSGGSLFTSAVKADTSLAISGALPWGNPSGVTLTGSPAAASWGTDHLDVFARGTNGKMYHATSDDGGSTVAWELLNSGTTFTRSPDAVTWGAGNIQVYGVQGSNIVKNTKDDGGSWSGWVSVNKPSGVNPSSKVSVASWGATNTSGAFPTNVRTVLAAFRGNDGKVWVGNSTGGSFTWLSFTAPANLTGDLDLSAWAPPRFDLFVLDTNGNFWDMSSTDGTHVSSSVNFHHPNAGGFQAGTGVAGLGDGRLLIGGHVGSNSAYLQLWNWKAGNWVSSGFGYTTAIDVASP